MVEHGLRLPQKTPAQRLLDALGPVEHYRSREEYGDFGLFSGCTMEEELEPVARAGPISQIGPLNNAFLLDAVLDVRYEGRIHK